MKICTKCKINKTDNEFYVKKHRKSTSSFCKDCFNSYCIERWIQRKKDAIKYKGGKCYDCQGIFPYVVYDFHHLNPAEKEFQWPQLKLRSDKAIKKELDKCILLCSNCHRIRHSII